MALATRVLKQALQSDTVMDDAALGMLVDAATVPSNLLSLGISTAFP